VEKKQRQKEESPFFADAPFQKKQIMLYYRKQQTFNRQTGNLR